jgi:hypothetical protein
MTTGDVTGLRAGPAPMGALAPSKSPTGRVRTYDGAATRLPSITI